MDEFVFRHYAYVIAVLISIIFSLRLLWFLRDRAWAGSMIFLRARDVSVLMGRFYLFLSLPLVLIMSLGVLIDMTGWTWLPFFQEFLVLIAFAGGVYFFTALSIQVCGRGAS